MDPAFSNPNSLGFLGNLSLDANGARNLLAVFVFLASALGFSRLWRKQRQLSRLNKAIKLHDEEAPEYEDFAAITGGALDHQAKRDSWIN